jgi:arsenate reductase (glutaredoxin)
MGDRIGEPAAGSSDISVWLPAHVGSRYRQHVPGRQPVALSLASSALRFAGAEHTPFCRIIWRETPMPVRIYHNPRCNTSRKTLALLQETGIQPEIVEYLKTPYTATQLKTLLGQMNLSAKAVVRKKEAAAAGIDPDKMTEAALIDAMVKHPILVERPIVVSGNKAALGRPPENVLSVL